AAQMTIGFVAPIIALATGVPWVSIDLLEYLLRATPPNLVLLGLAHWIRSRGWLRPQDAKIIGWEMILFQLARWPWIALGVAEAVIGTISRRELAFKVTPKGGGDAPALRPRLLAPYVGLAVGAAAAAALAPQGDAEGYRFLAVVTAVLYAVVASAIAALHLRETGDARTVRPVLAHLVGTWVVVGAAAVWRGGSLALFAEDVVEGASATVLGWPGRAYVLTLVGVTASCLSRRQAGRRGQDRAARVAVRPASVGRPPAGIFDAGLTHRGRTAVPDRPDAEHRSRRHPTQRPGRRWGPLLLTDHCVDARAARDDHSRDHDRTDDDCVVCPQRLPPSNRRGEPAAESVPRR
ncbi:MAG: hypothetical protein OEY23_25630, partial [Acidimicrobiia bacterium]|nr:hypothetical protein [Acidimicrobiia bacterium]